ncbi:hypothetical protein GUJ93_ZPchr0011g27100, partial [Zizania palustris]
LPFVRQHLFSLLMMQNFSPRHTVATWKRNFAQMLDSRAPLFVCCGVTGRDQIKK